ncbi:5-oxoprolinase subunit B family protein [Parasphingorhabdus halotolerans]|uniref:Allophanate hydrolase subunit 1 n=1 Tax=Parasphingorhabdus halotolerans TaxID=2725558 RepID=A0A6H2DGV1_9SPHN|nr:allophanate hydrolase subunit 1 [Parasphingorhabdus halotolerans]QJB67899.1 allophanate hydrolase subunit 1 [Parasphingorhabdus halotolerans]
METQSNWLEIVPGLETLAVQFDPAQYSPSEAETLLRERLKTAEIEAMEPSNPITIPVCYDPEFGPDQKLISQAVGVKPQLLAKWHCSLEFTVTMLGFMPGFGYLRSSKPVPNIGRLPQPRQKVLAGSVGIIGEQSCIYSFDSPGGWPIIGRTPLAMFDPARDQPAMLSPQLPVRFTPIDRDDFNRLLKEPIHWP